jgi:hypothetical protein
MRSLILLFLTAIAIVASPGCSTSDDAAPAADFDDVEAVPFASTIVLSPESAALVESVAPDGRVRFRSAPPELANVGPGTVFVAGAAAAAPAGLIRVVVSVERQSDALELRTLPAMPQLAYRKLHVISRRSNFELDASAFQPSPGIEPLSLGVSRQPLGARVPVDFLIFDADGDRETKDDQVRVVGSLEARIDYHADFDFDWGAIEDLPGAVKECLANLPGLLIGQLPPCTPLDLLPEIRATFDVTPRGIVDVNVEGAAALSYAKDFTLGTIPGPPIVAGPIVIRPTLEIRAGALGEASARFSTGMTAELAVTAGVTASSSRRFDLRPPSITKFDISEKPTELTLFARGRVWLGARLTLALWEIVGPYAELRGYGELSADATRTPCYKLAAGLDALFGLKVSTPELPVVGSVTLFDIESEPLNITEGELASGGCTFTPATRMPGQGPDPATLANPTAPRWQRSLVENITAPIVEGRPYDATIARVGLSRAIDGSFVALAKRSDTIVKFDREGTVRWTKQLPGPLFDIASGLDGTMRALSRDDEGGDFILTEIGQRGGVGRSWKYTLPTDAECTGPEPRRVLGLPNGDYAVISACVNERAVVAVVAGDGRPRHARSIAIAGGAVELTALVAKGSDLLVSGEYLHGTSGDLLVARFDKELATLWANRYSDCPNARYLVPSQMKPAFERDEILVVGGTGSGGAFFVRLAPGGELAFATFPWYSSAVSEHFLGSDIAELPQTGYLLAGSGVRLLAEGRTATATFHLDGAGRPMAAYRYASPTGHNGYPGIVIGDDGGFVLAAFEQESGTNGLGRLLGLAGYVKDGSTMGDLFVPGNEAGIGEAECTTAASPVALDARPLRLGWRLAR